MLEKAFKEAKKNQKAIVFDYYVNDPERYEVAEFEKKQCAKSLVSCQL